MLESWSGSTYEPVIAIESGGKVTTPILNLIHLLGEGDIPVYTGFVEVTGVGASGVSLLETGQVSIAAGNIVTVKTGGQVMSQDVVVEGGGWISISKSTEQNRSTWTVDYDLTLGGSFGNESRVNIDDNGLLDVQGNIIFTSGARMCVDGEVRTDPLLPAGFFELGCSLGTALIDGDFTLAPTGVLEVEINGTTPVDEHDMMIVTGDMEMQGTLHFIFGDYLPKQGDEFVFLDVHGNYVENGMKGLISGLKEGFEYRLDSVDGMLTLVAENDAEALSPDDPLQYLTPRLSSDGGLALQVYGAVGATYDFETSTDLETWETLSSEVGANALIDFSYLDLNTERRFYRLKKSSD